ncbi:MAG: hypothetical protein MUC50_15375 [Myxococcota bacterium]|nr:hypothetical protein [Myxococcota bacterium]
MSEFRRLGEVCRKTGLSGWEQARQCGSSGLAWASRTALLVVVAAILPSVCAAEEDEYSTFLKAKSAFDAGDYVTAAARFDGLLGSALSNPALAVECHKYAGVAFLFIADKERSERHFYDLLSLDPDYELDPLLFPIEVVDAFISVKSKNRERLEEIRRAKVAEEERRNAAQEAQRQSELAKLAQTFYVERAQKSRSLLVAVMPLGAGQFQNGHKTKGALLLSAELLLAAAATTSFALHESLRRKAASPIASGSTLERYEQQEVATRVVNQACLLTLGGVLIAGFIDSLTHFHAETVTWRLIKEEDVPNELRHRRGKNDSAQPNGPTVSLKLSGLGMTGQF